MGVNVCVCVWGGLAALRHCVSITCRSFAFLSSYLIHYLSGLSVWFVGSGLCA